MTYEELQKAKDIERELKSITEHISDIVYLMDRGVFSGSVGIEAKGTSCYRRISAKPETIMAFLRTVKNEHINRRSELEEELKNL